MIIDYSHIIASIIGILLGLFMKDVYKLIKKKWKCWRETTVIPIKLKFCDIVENEKELLGLKYSVLLVRHGKDKVKESGDLLNKAIKFEGHNPKIAKLRVHKVLGAQFKCFVDYKSEDQFDRIKSCFKEVSRDDDKMKKRAWFIHPDYSTCTTIDGYVNNFAHPPTYKE